nr:hypothetical protein DWF04_15180 [Cereibacter sphaeroides f. sp. denitrificans]
MDWSQIERKWGEMARRVQPGSGLASNNTAPEATDAAQQTGDVGTPPAQTEGTTAMRPIRA